jgi:hypothetical protein
LCISRVRDEVACGNISMVELAVGRSLDEAYLGISADVLIRPATAAPVDPSGNGSAVAEFDDCPVGGQYLVRLASPHHH